ncbi:MAG TPA: DUF1905 domain-containing protein [Sphingobium sp.]|nr:DUF1905 domain-containing protein [Sphingobium sp.]
MPAPTTPDSEPVSATAPLLAWRTDTHGDACYLRITGPAAEAISAHELVRRLETGRRRGFGSVKVAAAIGDSDWSTSVFPLGEDGWFLPVKKSICRAQDLAVGDAVTVRLALL